MAMTESDLILNIVDIPTQKAYLNIMELMLFHTNRLIDSTTCDGLDSTDPKNWRRNCFWFVNRHSTTKTDGICF